jgi:hypothetical protein
MLFRLTILDHQAQFREFSCMLDKLEVGFDFLNTVVAGGETLIKVLLIENGKESELPLEVFDGFPCLEPIQQLENEWEYLLSQPVRSISIIDQELIDLTRKRMHQCEANVSSQKLVISRFKTLLIRAEAGIRDQSIKSRLILHYKLEIDRYEQQMAKSQLYQKLVARRLDELIQV